MATSSDSDGPIINDNVIRIQLRKPSHRKWELRTRNHSPSVKFPTIQLFDCEGNLLVETNDDNISIKSSDFDGHALRSTQSLKEKDYKHFIDRSTLKKHNTISNGDKVYTRVYKHTPSLIKANTEQFNKSLIVKDINGVTNIPVRLLPLNNSLQQNLLTNSLDSSRLTSDGLSDLSSYKSSDNETFQNKITNSLSQNLLTNINRKASIKSRDEDDQSIEISSDRENESFSGVHKSRSFNDIVSKRPNGLSKILARSKSNVAYKTPHNKISFLNTYLKSLPTRASSNSNWLISRRRVYFNKLRKCSRAKEDSTSENDFINVPTDVAADCEMRKRLKMYRRGISEIEVRRMTNAFSPQKRRHSVTGAVKLADTSSSESVDEADVVLNRLKRRLLRNKFRERRRSLGAKFLFGQPPLDEESDQRDPKTQHDVTGGAPVRSRLVMGSNISQHSSKGLKGRRARSSGDLCNGDTKSQTETSVCGSVVGDIGWNRSLPNHLDGNRHLADYSRVNNNYAEFATYNRCHPKGGRGLRYRVSKSGSVADPVWKLQDPGFDQGYGSERSPEDDYLPPIVQLPPVSMEQYEAELRTVYPFINDDNTFTVVVEKDGRGLGMSVCGGGGLVRIRRLYPPQPAWRTGRLAPRDLLLSANGVPLAGLSTYEALEVLRTAAARVEMRVCRPPPEVLESVTPPDPPTPPARCHPQQPPPVDPLNCHPMHARLSATTSSATTSSSEGRGRREQSPEADRQNLHLPDLDKHLPVYDVQYGEFDIIMAKVNGSLGFTLRKEDHSALGHYVRALVREPALSDGRIQPGDRIVAVNDTPMSNMSHAEAVAFLRSCDSEVRLRLYRDHAATPLSPMSPKEEGPTDSDTPMHRPKPPLRPEAVSMLYDLAARRLTPDTTDGSKSPCLSPRKFRKLTKDNNHYEQPHQNDAPNPKVKIQFNEPESKESKDARRTNTLALASPTVSPTTRKQKLSLTVPPCGYELNNLDNDTLDAPNVYQEDTKQQRFPGPAFPADSDEPVSMPVEMFSDEARFKHMNPTYQSAVLHTTTSDGSSDAHNKDDNGLKKWKGISALSPDNERKTIKLEPIQHKPIEVDSVQKENVNPDPAGESTNNEPTIVTVELNRGWNSRLGFSVQSHPDSGQSYISAVYNDSVAARDGRLHTGDVILQVNDENVTSMKTPEVIDLLRLLRGSICITVLRPPNKHN